MKRGTVAGALLPAVVAAAFLGCGKDAPTATSSSQPAAAQAAGVRMTLVSGDGQTGAAGQTLPEPLVVRVVDPGGRPVAEAVVNWNPMPGGGSADPRRSTTDAGGYARTRWTLGPQRGEQTMRAAGTGGTILFSATAGEAGPPVAMYALPNPMWLSIGDTARLRVVFLDAAGNVVPGPRPSFQVMSNYSTVDPTGLVRATRPGNGGIVVRAGAFGALVSVNPHQRTHERYGSPREWLYVVPERVSRHPGDTTRLNALWVDAEGEVTNARSATWSALSPGTASVAADGLVTAVRPGAAAIYARLAPARAARSSIDVTAPSMVLEGLAVTPDPVRAGAEVRLAVRLRYTSAVRIARLSVQVRTPGGTVVERAWSGTAGTATIPASAPRGRYEIVRVRLVDAYGYVVEGSPEQLRALGSPTHFTVIH